MTLAIDPKLDIAQVNLGNARENGVLNRETKDLADREQIKKLSRDFESIFLGIMLKSMRDAVPKSGLMDGGNAEDIYRSMLDAEYSHMMADQNQTGLAKNIEDFLLRAAQLEPVQVAKATAPRAEQVKGVAAYKEAALDTQPKTKAEKRLDAIVSRMSHVIKE